jgi:hypothetical protein
VFSEDDETLAQVTGNCISYLNHCFRTTVCDTYDNPMLLLWVVYLHVVVLKYFTLCQIKTSIH